MMKKTGIFSFWALGMMSSIALASGADSPPLPLTHRPYIEPSALERLESLMDDPSSFVGIEIIEAEGTDEIASWFGHSLIRFIDNDGDSFNDIVFNFYPVLKDENGNSVEGVDMRTFREHYQLGVEMNNLQNIGLRYAKLQGRELYRLPVLTTAETRRKILLDIEKVLNDPELRGHYTALGNNCLGVVLDSLRRAGLPAPKRSAFLPSHAGRYFSEVGLAPYPEITFNKAETLLNRYSKNIDEAEAFMMRGQSERAYDHLSVEAAWVAIAVKERNEIRDEFYEVIRRKMFESEGSLQIRDRLFGATPMNPMLYSLCESEVCADLQIKALKPQMGKIAPKAKNPRHMVRLMRGEFIDEKPIRRVRTPRRSLNAHKAVARKHVDWGDLRDVVETHYELLYKAAR